MINIAGKPRNNPTIPDANFTMKCKTKSPSYPSLITIIICFLQLLSSGSQCYAQTMTLGLTSLNTADQLSQNTIQCIYQDHFGFMWFGTQEGLNKYDGYRIEVFKYHSDDKNSISANHITAISEDKQGNLWVGTRTGGLNMLNRTTNTFTRYQNSDKDKNSIDSNQVNVLLRDSQSNIWVGTPAGLNLMSKGSPHFKRIPLSSLAKQHAVEDVRAIFEDSRQNVWIGTTGKLTLLKTNAKGLYTFQHQYKNEDGNNINAIIEDDRGNIWIGSDNGLKVFNKNTGTFSSHSIKPDLNSEGGRNPIYCLVKDAGDRFWIGSNTTLQLFDAASRTLVPISDRTDGDSHMPNDGIYSLYQDSAHCLWIGTTSQGILKFDRNLTIFESYKASLTNTPSAKNIIRGIAEDDAGNLYIATDAGLEHFDRRSLSYQKYIYQRHNRNSLSSNYTSTVIFSKKSGLVWIGTYSNGIDLFNPKTGGFEHITTKTKDRRLNSNAIDILMEDRLGRVWIGTDGGGINMYDPASNKVFTYVHNRLQPDSSLCDDTVLALSEDRTGKIWIGGYSKGISILDPQRNTFSQLNTKNSKLTSDVVSCFHQDVKGNMWIGTQGGGLNRYDHKTGMITSITEENGLISNSINYISEDATGKLWISTNRGIVSLDPEKIILRNFTKVNNLKTMEFNLGSGSKLRTGEIVMGSINGFNIINPAHLNYNINRPEIVFTGLQLFNKPVTLKSGNTPLKKTLLTSKELTLDYTQSVITISFAALDFTSPEYNQYSYFLTGFDQEWNNTGNMHTASYTNLNPGTYHLKVKAANNDGIWSDKEASLIIHIKSPYWMTWWFKFAVVLLLATALYWFYRYKIIFERKQKAKLTTLVRLRTAKISDQASHLNKLNGELVKNTASLEQLTIELTAQKAQEHRARLVAESAQKQADAANSAKSTFLTTMSHELRTPINGVMGMASLLTETTLSDEQKEYTDAILNSGQSLLSVINDVLDFSKIESGNIVLEQHSFELRKCLEDVFELFGHKILDSGIDLLYLIEEQVPAYVIADSLRLRQILINLVGNAVKFTNQGEVCVKITSGSVSENDFKLRFMISDTGIGIPESQQKNLFKAFHQLDSSITRKYGGSGLGLVICERLVKLMGGQIEVDSKFGTGTTFSFEIACLRDKYAHSYAPEGEPLIPNGQCVLIVSSNKTSQEAIKNHISQMRISAIVSDSDEKALEILSSREAVKLVITDMRMPGSLKLAEQIRKVAPGISVILLGHFKNEHQRDLKPYFNAILSKPVRHATLLNAIKNSLNVDPLPEDNKKAILSEKFVSHYPYQILIAEDILMNQKLIIWVLNKLGYQPDLANNGIEVLEMMETKSYDIILMDLQMPLMGGIEATRIIRQQYGVHPLIIALTANALPEDREVCLSAGMNDYITKPINLELLTKSLMNLHSNTLNN